MKTMKYLLTAFILFGLNITYGQFNTFQMDKKGDVKLIRQNKYYPVDTNQLSAGFYVWCEIENYKENGDFAKSSFETEGAKVPVIRYEFHDYKGLEKIYTDPLWETLPKSQDGQSINIKHLDPMLISSAEPNLKDAKGNVVEATFSNKCSSYTEKFAYDHENNCIERTQFDAQGNLVFKVDYIYAYDEKGNWINRTTLLNGKLYCVHVREITYNK